MTKSQNQLGKPLILILLAVDFIWLKSSFGKLTEGKFVGSLGSTLTKMAANNPYPPVKDFLQNIAIPNSQTFGYLTMYGETLVAVSMLISIVALLFAWKINKLFLLLLVLALSGGMFLNAVFWLSSGWSSPSGESLNMLMFAVEGISFWVFVKTLAKKAA